MGFTRISNASLNSRGATTLPNQPQISAAALKQEFDAPAKNVVAPAVNNLMDELEASTGAGNIGAVAPTGRTGSTVQGVINSVSGDLATLEAAAGTAIADAHTHSNKALLDTYTQTEEDLASAVADDHTHSNKSLLDSYDQTNADIKQAVTDDHTHSNKALLDTYTQTETDLADAVSKKHSHSNKALLDTYTQTETDLADAVSKKHAHSNKSLLDTYTQTETDIADAVSKKHSHSNKSVIDDLSDDGAGNLLYDGNPVGGGTVDDAYKSVKVDSTTITASGEDTLELEAGANVTLTPDSVNKKVTIAASGGTPDAYKIIESAGSTFTASGADTFKINAGSNVTITALSSPDKGIQISATGGGQSTGDMLMTDYDSQGDVKTAGGIDAYVSAEIGKLDGTVSGSAGTGKTLSAFSQTDGKVSATFSNISITKSQVSDFPTLAAVATSGSYSDLSNKPSIPTITDTYDGTSSNGMSGKAVKSAIDALDVTTTGAATNKTITALTQTDGKIAATFQDISITKSQVSDFPTIPTVNDSTITIKRNSSTTVDSFTTNASSAKTITLPLDDWTSAVQVDNNNQVTFTGLNDAYGYDLYCENKLISVTALTISGSGTNVTAVYTVSGATAGTDYCKLRVLK